MPENATHHNHDAEGIYPDCPACGTRPPASPRLREAAQRLLDAEEAEDAAFDAAPSDVYRPIVAELDEARAELRAALEAEPPGEAEIVVNGEAVGTGITGMLAALPKMLAANPEREAAVEALVRAAETADDQKVYLALLEYKRVAALQVEQAPDG